MLKLLASSKTLLTSYSKASTKATPQRFIYTALLTALYILLYLQSVKLVVKSNACSKGTVQLVVKLLTCIYRGGAGAGAEGLGAVFSSLLYLLLY